MQVKDEAARPPVASREEWLQARKEVLAKERELTHLRDALGAARRRMPMVRIEKDYVFESPEGRVTLADLFGGRRQLIVYHFMFDPGEHPEGRQVAPFSEGCPGCSHMVDNMPHPAHLRARDTNLVLVSRAPVAKILPFKQRMGWTLPWVSSFGSDFNYDFHVTADEQVQPVEYNFKSKAELEAEGQGYHLSGEQPGISVFLKTAEGIFHTYSTYARGLDAFINTHNLLDLTPLGRQEEWEDSPEGWPQDPTHSWLRHHDRYEGVAPKPCCH